MTRKFYETHLKWYNIIRSRVRSCVPSNRPNRPTTIHRCHEMPWRPLECAVILKNAIATACVLSFRASSCSPSRTSDRQANAFLIHAPRWALIRSILLEIDEPLFAIWMVGNDNAGDDESAMISKNANPMLIQVLYIFGGLSFCLFWFDC